MTTFKRHLLPFLAIGTIVTCLGFTTVLDSLTQLLKSTQIDSSRIDLLTEIANAHFDNASYTEGFKHIHEAITLSKSSTDYGRIGTAYYSLAYGYDLRGNLDSALINYDLSAENYLLANNLKETAGSLNGKGVAAYYQGNYEKALEYYLEALAFAETHELNKNIANLLNNIGVSYRLQDKNDEAIEIYHKAIGINRQLDDERGLAQQYNNLGVAYTYKKELKPALNYLDSALMMYTNLKDQHEIAFTHSSFGNAYFEVGKDLDKARYHLLKANGMLKEVNFIDDLAKNIGYLVAVEREANNIDQAILYAKEGLALTENTDREKLKLSFHEQLHKLYHKQGNIYRAYDHQSAYVSQSKKIQKSETLAAIEELQTKYNTEQKEQQIKIQALELTQLSNQKKNFIAYLSLAGLALLFAIWFISNKMKTNHILRAQKAEIQTALEEKNILLREIHHRVKNNLQVISSLLGLQSKYTDDPNIEEAIKQGKNRVHSMTLIHQNLYQEDNLTGVDIKQYFTKLFTSLFKSYNLSGDRIKLDVNIEPLNLDVDSIVPIGLVVNELVTNALKHAFPNDMEGIITVTIHEKDNNLVLMVSDNGIGLPNNLNTSESGSFGFELIEAFRHKLKAEMSVSSDHGTTVGFTIKNYIKVAA